MLGDAEIVGPLPASFIWFSCGGGGGGGGIGIIQRSPLPVSRLVFEALRSIIFRPVLAIGASFFLGWDIATIGCHCDGFNRLSNDRIEKDVRVDVKVRFRSGFWVRVLGQG